MGSFIQWVFDSFFDLLMTINDATVFTIDNLVVEAFGMPLNSLDINLVLFSDTPIFTGSAFHLLTIFFSIFYTVIFIVIVWKIIKKVFVKITGWKKW